MDVKNKNKRAVRSLLAAAFAAACVPLASAAPVTYYSLADVNSAESVNDSSPDRVQDFNGGPVQSQASGSRAWAYSNGAGGFIVNTETSSVYSRADLGSGTLKAATSLGLGTITSGTPPAAGARYASASATAEFADQFRLYSGGTPYLWGSDTEVSFAMNVTGSTAIPGSMPVPADSLGMTWAHLGLRIFKVGTLDLIDQLGRIDLYPDNTFDEAAYQRYLALNAQINANFLLYIGWCLGDGRTPSGFCGAGADPIVTLVDGAAEVSYTFTPGEDFEWILSLDTQVRLDLSLQNLTATLDFGNTIGVGFEAPQGATVYSGSGLFPNTRPLDELSSSVPEPHSLALCIAALLALASQRRFLERGRARRPGKGNLLRRFDHHFAV